MLVHFLIRALSEYQTYTHVFLENDRLYVCKSLRWVGTPFVLRIGLLVW